ncbi:MAG TPA: alpha/beta fold hydrolase, partial [Gammaproteobacteria bacterium]|nr:alpha/beta fold hydrolase [Gammaproteobacteria bacterium]
MIRSSLKNNSGEEFSYVSNRPIESGAPLFIFFHATGFNGQTYWQLIKGLDSLFKEEINFMSLDQRGHGHTKAKAIPEELNSWSPFIEDALEIVDKLEGPIFCAGHSMGAIVAAKIA